MTTKVSSKRDRYPFVWIEEKALFHTKSRKTGWLAICGYSKRVAKIAPEEDYLTPFVVQDVLHHNGVCEEGKRCLDFSCPLNRTTWESFQACYDELKDEKKPAKWGTPIAQNRNPDGSLQNFEDIIEGKEAGTIIMRKRKGR